MEKWFPAGDGGGGCGESPKVEDGNQSRLKWIEREREEDGRDQRGHSCPVVLLVVFWLVDIFFLDSLHSSE